MLTKEHQGLIDTINLNADRMGDITKLIEEKLLNRLTLLTEVSSLRDDAEAIKVKTTLETAEQATNDTKRKALCEQVLSEHQRYQQLQAQISAKQNDIAKLDITLERERKHYEIIKLYIESYNATMKYITL